MSDKRVQEEASDLRLHGTSKVGSCERCKAPVQALEVPMFGTFHLPAYCASCVRALDEEDAKKARAKRCEEAITAAGVSVRAARAARARVPNVPPALMVFGAHIEVPDDEAVGMMVVGRRSTDARTFTLHRLVAESVRNHVKTSEGRSGVLCLSEAKLLSRLAQGAEVSEFVSKRLLIIDAFGSTPSGDWVVSKMQLVLEGRADLGRPTVFGLSAPPVEQGDSMGDDLFDLAFVMCSDVEGRLNILDLREEVSP